MTERPLNDMRVRGESPFFAGTVGAYCSGMEFLVLGPLEVRAEDRYLPLGTPAERHLLAVLLVYANETVSTDRLVDELWGNDPPQTARNMIQRYVSRLRVALGDAGGERLATELHGYQLRVEDRELDARQFERLVAEGRAAPDPETAVARLREGLGLWRGVFLDGIDAGSAVGAERVRWQESGLVALEERIELDLALGNHRDLVPELQGLTGRFPLRERLCAQLMLALHRCGRQAEALRAFTAYRDHLGEEAGLEPSSDLLQLEEQILLGDPRLAAPGLGAKLPAGEVTFLFTDIIDSTTLWEEHPEAMPGVLARHEDVLSEAVENCDGVVFKSVGDGVRAAFSSAQDAVRAALNAQKRLAADSWDGVALEVRMALHTGAAQPSSDDYVGPSINRTARLLATAHGGQIVATQATVQLARDQLPVDASLTDLGEHHLKGLIRPERVFQIDHPELCSEFPLLRSLGSYTHNLPHRLTEFIGRRREIEVVAGQLRNRRLVTLIGVGGVGKTSLAIRVTAEIVDAFPGGVWLVELAALPQPDLIGDAVAGVLGIKLRPSENVAQTLARHLADSETLLVLDNCEHLIDGAAKFTAALLEASNSVRVLATSREPLAIAGEGTLHVPSLDLPATADLPPAELEAIEAVALFLDRARLVVAGFTLDADNASAVAEICCRLDGIPLAIELAAARLNTLTPRQIADELDDRFHLLTKGLRTAPSRHRTLQALVDWSHNLLTEPEQVLLRRLSAFSSSFTLEAVEQVCGFDPLDEPMIADLLERLCDTSMVIPPQPPASRYRMLETIHQYARRHLNTAGETNPAMKRLAEYLDGAAPGSWVDLNLPDPRAWYAWLDQESDNYRACLTWALTTKSKEAAARAAIEFQEYLTHAGHPREAETWVTGVLDVLGDEPTPLRLRLLGIAAGAFLGHRDPSGSRHLIERLRTDAEALGDEGAAGIATWLEATLVERTGNLAIADTLHKEAERCLRAANDPRHQNALAGRIICLIQLGRHQEAENVAERLEAASGEAGSWPIEPIETAETLRVWTALARGDHDEAQRRLDDANIFANGAGYPDLLFRLETLRCELALQRGDLDAARDVATRCRLLADELGLTAGQYLVERLQSLIELDAAEPGAAAAHVRVAIECAETLANRIDQTEVVAITGDIALAVGDPAEATLLHAAASAARHRTHLVLGQWNQRRHDQALHGMRTAIGSVGFERKWTEGNALSLNDAMARARHFIQDLIA